MTDFREVFDDCAARISSELDACDDLISTLRQVIERGDAAAGLEGAAMALDWFAQNPAIAQRIAMAIVIGTIARDHLAAEGKEES